MSVNHQAKGPNELRKTNQIISEQIAKIQKDTQELINRTIDGKPASVNVVKISENKIIIEVDLNEFNLNNQESENLIDDHQNDSTNETVKDTTNKPTNKSIDKSTSKDELEDETKNEDKNETTSQQTLNDDDDQLNNENVDSDGKPLKGILKYTNSWKKRTLSESSFDNSSSFTDHEDEDNNFSLSCADLDCYSNDRSSCKKVTFSKQISSKLFTKNQRTIESRPKRKGKKKNQNKKAKGNFEEKKSIELLANRTEKQIKMNAPVIDDVNKKNNNEKNESANISIDELSFLICDSDSTTDDSGNNADVSSNLTTNSIVLNGLDSIIDDDDSLFDEQKIEHHSLDKENWSEVKSTKKMKKNRKRNDSGSNGPSNNDQLSNATNSTTDSGNREISCDDQATKQQMSLGIKNTLEIQVN